MGNEKLLIGNIRSAKDVGSIAVRYRKMQALTQDDLAGLAQTGNRFISDRRTAKELCNLIKSCTSWIC